MRYVQWLQAFVLSAAIVGCSATTASRESDSLRGNAQAVEAFFLAGINAFNAHDLDAFMEQFGEDIQMYTPTGWLRGKQAVRERFQTTFEQFPGVRMELEDLQAREVAPRTVVTDFKWRMYPQGAGPAFHGVGSGVYVQRGGKWVEVLEHETVVQVDEALQQRPPDR